MAISKENIEYLIDKVKPLLDQIGVDYWLGRGVLRNFYINNEIGDKNSDLDFHIWKEDEGMIREKLEPIFEGEEFIKDNPDYKLAFYKPRDNHEFFVEFMFLFSDPTYPELVYHARHDGKKWSPRNCFSDKPSFLKIKNTKLRIPNSADFYFAGIYGPNWKENNHKDKEFSSSPEFVLNLISKEE